MYLLSVHVFVKRSFQEPYLTQAKLLFNSSPISQPLFLLSSPSMLCHQCASHAETVGPGLGKVSNHSFKGIR